jgi:hypothetical protein
MEIVEGGQSLLWISAKSKLSYSTSIQSTLTVIYCSGYPHNKHYFQPLPPAQDHTSCK